MAGLAGLRESALHVVGIRRVLEIRQVARDAGRGREVVVVVDVAIGALPRRHGVRVRSAGSSPSSGRKLAGCQAVVVWQVWQVCEKFPATWFGLVVP